MKPLFILSLLCWKCLLLCAQPGASNDPATYQATPEKITDLVHTRLDAKFNYEQAQLIGKVWLTLKPHFYPTDSLLLDAKAMDIRQVALVKGGRNVPLKYFYDGMQLNIDLDRTYKRGESYTVYIDYTAKPDEFEGKGSAAITGAKGLYFIDPREEEPEKPTQIWTQGETEATSVYVPTIDKPNQKTTQEFYLTVPSKYVTLSNGKLMSQKKNADGTRTDYWKMDQPHAPYLFFIGVGDYAVVKDSYKGKEVSYYVEKAYAPVARKIFGNTPEMMGFFSRITGVEYPWVKYGQMTARDYVSGAMENTTATLHSDAAQQDARELTDGNRWEDVIAHELFHQWFGDLVTTESWSNLTLNESFANYSEYLWNEYKYGKDAADAHHYSDMQAYLQSPNEHTKNLVRYHYRDKEEMFDLVSYNKGGRILHMLRHLIGDSAFFKGMNLYLTTNKYKTAEAHQLRLAFEEVTGRDLNPFFNQWYFGSGHPRLHITYGYDGAAKQARVIVAQTQPGDKVFRLPVSMDVYHGADVMRYQVVAERRADTFVFASLTRPDLINFDSDKILLAEKTENKTLDEYLHQYKHARNFIDRREAIDAAVSRQAEARAAEIMLLALEDPFHGLRSYAIDRLDLNKQAIRTAVEPQLYQIAQKDPKRTVRAAAIRRLGEYGFARYANLYQAALNDSSYTVAAAGLEALARVDTARALEAARRLEPTAKGRLADVIPGVYIRYGDPSIGEKILQDFERLPLGQEKLQLLQPLATYLERVSSFEVFKRGIDAIDSFHKQVPEAYQAQITPYLEGMLRDLQKIKNEKGQQQLGNYINSKIGKRS